MNVRQVVRFVESVAVLLLVFAGTQPAMAQSFDEAIEAYHRGDFTTAYLGFRTYAEQGDPGAQFNLGIMYLNGRGVPQDHAEAAQWFFRAAEQGVAKAQLYLGMMYDNGEGVPLDDREAVKWYRRAAEQGDAKAQLYLGIMYDNGEGVLLDDREAVKWYRRAAEQGDAKAQLYLGMMYDNGEGVPLDDREAVKWYRRAAEQGDAKAQLHLGMMYDNGEGVPLGDREAVKWYRRAAEQGDAKAQLHLGMMYDNGEGVPLDDREAVKWYRRAAEQGDAKAQLHLGIMYDNGEGVPLDDREAAKWYRRAAEQGDAKAQLYLGMMYDDGEGVPQDDYEAVKWYRRAAEQGDPSAQFNLGLMYEYGEGVVPNFGGAHKWFNLAASRFSASEQDLRKMAVEARDRVALRLSPAELAIAQRLAREWQPQVFDSQRLVAEASPPASTPTDDQEYQIRTLQRTLHKLGYYAGPFDGRLDSRTRMAIRAFEADNGLDVTGQVTEVLVVALGLAELVDDLTATHHTRSLNQESTGSGFQVSAQGHYLTNAHVVQDCTEVRISSDGPVDVVAREDSTDLALLQAHSRTSNAVAAFRQGRGIRPGASVVVVGYPLRGLVASAANVTTGSVSALAGPGDDRRLIQITAPVQPGNSGGPVLDAAGNVVGVVVSKLDAIKVANITGDIPQNVNFAISAGSARAFLDDQGVPYGTAPSNHRDDPVGIAAAARKFTVLVECWN